MNYAFLGRMIPDELQEMVAKLSVYNMQDAANALQWHLYDGLCQNLKCDIQILNVMPIGSYPQYYKKPFVKESRFTSRFGDDNLNIGFCNVKLIRNASQARQAQKALFSWCEQNDDNRFVFVYTLSTPLLSAIESVKEKFPALKVCAIVADLPNMASLSSKRSFLLQNFQKNMSEMAYAKLGAIDYFVLLTEQMAEYMNIKKPYCVVEGISTIQGEEPDFAPRADGKKLILYTGTLHKRFGIMNLVEAFMRIPDPNFELVICGIGDSEAEIREAAEKDARIQFLGQKPRTEVLEIQRNASVLVNPRQNIEEFTKYSFPSKNLEYLSSGKPLVAYKLDGIPDEYDDYILYVKDNSIEALTEKLMEVCHKPDDELKAHCQKAYQFVKEQKNEVAQTERILKAFHLSL